MHVGPTRRIAAHGAQHLHAVQAHAAPHVPVHGLQAAPMPPLADVKLPGAYAKADGSWTVDAARARHDAQVALDAIDWSKPDIVIWVPGTDNHAIHSSFGPAAREAWGPNASVSLMDYEASWELRRSVPTGLATLRLVLEAIKAHGGNHRVLLAGESQGAWIIGEALADPKLRPVVERAVLYGHPFLAAHDYADGHDQGVIEVNHPGDQVAAPIKGDIGNAMDAMAAIHQMNPGGIGKLVKAIGQNPDHGAMLLKWAVRSTLLKGVLQDPHDYGPDMAAGVEFLKWGKAGDPSLGDDAPRVDAGPGGVPTVRTAA